MSNKVIFLDIDGVLNHGDFCAETPNRTIEAYPLDKKALTRLKTIVDETNADIVLSSSWRMVRQLKQAVKENLALFDMEFIGVTSCLYKERGYEIQKYLDEHPEIEQFVILDDDADMVHLMPHLVQTTWDHGLLDEHVAKAIEILSKERKDKDSNNETS